MEKFKLAFGIHNHQPVGNFTAVFEEAHTRAYLPFLELLDKHSDIRLSLHQSGILWDWQKQVHPEYFQLVGKLVDRGQIELLTGGFFEPILTSIPARDALGQIRQLTAFLKDHFGVDPKGLWLTERIWEPHLPKLLAEAGVEFLPIDDTHFIYSGFEHRQLTGPFVTEDEGKTVRLLPIQKRLRYLIPFGTVAEVIENLQRQAEARPGGMAVYADDGEKFGVWPNTHKHCYEDGWLEDFFATVDKHADWLEIVPLGEVSGGKAAGRAYLPTASYEEMLHWSLPPTAFVAYENFEKWLEMSGASEEYGRFVRGGHWRGFLAKYDESNLMHKKMLWVSDALVLAEKDRPNDPKVAEARRYLYAAQCNCPYWHGVFGGLYLPHIRQAIYANLVEAHRRLQTVADGAVEMSELDYDRDGNPEILVDSTAHTAVFTPSRGGAMVDLALNQHAFDLTDTLTRRKEGYHLKLDKAVMAADSDSHASIHDQVLTKEEGLSRYLVEDWYLKRCFIDHFFTLDVDLETFHSAKFGEEGDFVLEPFEYQLMPGSRRVIMSREGHIWRPQGKIDMHLTKEFTFDPERDQIVVNYALASKHPGGVDVNFAIENSFNFQAGHAEDRFVMVDSRRDDSAYLDSVGWHSDARGVALVDEYRRIAVALASDRPADIWHLPLFTVSLSEGGFEKVYQGTTIVHRYRLHVGETPERIRLRLHAGAASGVLKGAFAVQAVGGA